MFSWQYLLMAFLACLGIVQLAAARTDRRHLWLLRQRRLTAVLGVVLMLTGVALFYLTPLWIAGPWGPPDLINQSPTWAPGSFDTLPGARNINDTAGGLSGHWQALWFTVAWIGAVFFAQAVNRSRRPLEAKAQGIANRERELVDSMSGNPQ